MYQIQQITRDPLQQQSLVLPDGSIIDFTLQYLPQQYGWFMNLTYGTLVLQGTRITVSPNILHQFRNQLPFGLTCHPSVNIQREPTQQDDFVSGAFSMFVLDSTEVGQYHSFLQGM